MVFPVPGGPNSTYGLGRHSPARILFTASLWGGFRSGLKKCPWLGIGLDGRLPPGGDLALISVLCERQSQSLNQTESPALVPLVCVAFDFMSMEMLDTFSFPAAAAWDSGIGLIFFKNWQKICVLFSLFTSFSSTALLWSGSSIHFPVHWEGWGVTLEGNSTTQKKITMMEFFSTYNT